jgi:CheY-like chemotaxis protein
VYFLINKFNPVAITLDAKLPDASGWRILDLLKNDINLRHIPVHLISGEENRLLAIQRGARSFHLKPLKNESLSILFGDIGEYSNRKTKCLLVIGDNDSGFSELTRLLGNNRMIRIDSAATGKEGLELARKNIYDCIIVGGMLPGPSGMELITGIADTNKSRIVPVIIYSAKEFSAAEKTQLKQYVNRIIKNAGSPELLLEEVIMHIHFNYRDLLPEQRRIIDNLRSSEDILTGKTVLVVDDDVRNLFALTTAFERHKMKVMTAESGQEAIDALAENNRVDIVLMDIMMPEMDGYETTQKIRRENKNHQLPIIAVTAKAMKGDREKCIEAGASDYIPKPVKIDQLLSLMRVWLYK